MDLRYLDITGSSWLISNMLEFGARFPRPSPDAKKIFAIQSAAFGGPEWYVEGRPSASFYLDHVPERVITDLTAGVCNLLFDVSNEGQPLLEEWFTMFHRALFERRIPSDRVVFLQQNRSLPCDYNRWAKSNNIIPLNVMVYDHFARRMTGLLAKSDESPVFSDKVRGRRFTCLNYTPRAGRTSLVSWLFGRGFDKSGYISFAGPKIAKWSNERLQICEWYPEIETVRVGLEKLLVCSPIQLDLNVADNRIPEYDIGPAYAYEDSYFSIITESEQSGGELERITEKIIKPLAMMHPAIIIGNPNSLEILKRYGFRTFGEFIDESYDTVSDPIKRTEMVFAEIDKLMSMCDRDIHSLFNNMKETLLYNALQARKLLSLQFCQVIEPTLLEAISLT